MSPDGDCEGGNARMALYEAESAPPPALLIARGTGGARAPDTPTRAAPAGSAAGGPGWPGVALFRACGGLK